MVDAEFGLSVNELFQLILLFVEEMFRSPTLAFEFLPASEPSVREPVFALCDRLSRSAQDLRQLTRERQSYDVNWAYNFNPMRAYPLVHAGNARSVMCPAPPLLVYRLTGGLYFDLIKGNSGFGNAVGKAFEDYVGAVARRIGEGALRILPEQCWGKPERRSVDWIIEDAGAALFVECKLGRLDVASQTEIAAEPPFLAAIERLAGHVGQLYATLAEALAGGYPHWQPDSRPVHPLVVTFHEWFVFGPFFYKHLDQLVAAEFEKRRLDPILLGRYPYTVCSIAELEGLLTAVRQNTIDSVLSIKNSTAHRQSLLRGFLADLYPGSLSNAMGTFDDGMDVVVDAPSRLTRS
jgi:hypothetical protein